MFYLHANNAKKLNTFQFYDIIIIIIINNNNNIPL